MSIIDEFVAVCKQRGEKNAFISQGKRVSYRQLLSDIYRMAERIKEENIAPGEPVLVFVRPSYELYLLLLAGLCTGVNLVVPDAFKSRKRIRAIVEQNRIKHVFCDPVTRLLKPMIGQELTFVNVHAYTRYAAREQVFSPCQTATVLTTFTSGTTGEPKPIRRTLCDLQKQIDIVSKNVEIASEGTVLTMLPIYTLFAVFCGLSCVVSRKINREELLRCGVTTVIAPISKLLEIRQPISFVKKVYIGGAILYPRETEKMLQAFPKAHIEYVYGSSECVLMAKTELRHYLKTFAFDGTIDGITLSFVDRDPHGVGQICVSGAVVLSEDKTQVTNDLGYVDGDGLHIVGRKKFSVPGCYNYVKDVELLSKHPAVRRGFSFVHQGITYFCYEGKLSPDTEKDVTFVRFRKIPTDAKHQTKLDYQRTFAIMKAKGIVQ